MMMSTMTIRQTKARRPTTTPTAMAAVLEPGAGSSGAAAAEGSKRIVRAVKQV